ncbi:MAG: ATP-binding cassette domain-containing protein [Alphaproteobacteria bacterium]|nr:ATP-binding cassette domain-containing protein [Alphaproteobacteria bacterium]
MEYAVVDTPSLIEASGLKVSRGGQVILNGINLTVDPGEIVTLIGPNGAGKSTLVRALLGLERIDSGTITRKAELVIGYQAQSVVIDATLPLTVRRFLTLTCNRPDDELSRTLNHVQLNPILDKSVHVLSGGEMQRVQLARAILRNPDLLVLDEPTQNVDISGAIELYRLIQETRDRLNCAVIMVSHDLNVVMSATTRVYCLNNHICCSGRPAEVSKHPEFLRLFGQSAADMLAIYTHNHDHGPTGEVLSTHNHTHDHPH